MPQFLKSAALELLQGAIEMYKLALFGLGVPKFAKSGNEQVRYAPIISLLGASTELLIKTFIVHGLGIKKVYIAENINSGKFVNTKDLIKLLEQNIKCDADWVKELLYSKQVDEERKKSLLKYIAKIRMLQNLRSQGLHAGKGCLRDVAVVLANDVYDLFSFLSINKRFKAYLKNIPSPEPLVKDREVIIDDLKRYIKPNNIESKLDYFANLFLVLPYIPDNAPEWVEQFEEIKLADPKDNDASFLVQTLEEAHSISLLKSRGGKRGVPVRVENNNPHAVPIMLETFKRRLNTPSDIFYNAVVAANTRLESGQIDLPCEAHLIELFDSSIDVVQTSDKFLSADQAWPFLATAISFSGTPLPCFQFIKYCDELPKLRSLIEKVKKYANGYYKNRADALLLLIDSKINGTNVNWDEIPNTGSNAIFKSVKDYKTKYGTSSKSIFPPDFIKSTPVKPAITEIMEAVVAGHLSAGEAVKKITSIGDYSCNVKKIINRLLDNCNDFENRCAFKAILDVNELKSLHTRSRKQMLYIDFYYNFVGDVKIK